MPKFVDDVHVAGGFSAYAADTATGAVVRAGAGQTDPIQVWEASDGTIVAEVDIDGTIKVGGVALGSGGGGWNFLGNWGSGTTYAVGDVVKRGGRLHLASGASTGVDPTSYPTVGGYTGGSLTWGTQGGDSGYAQPFTPTTNLDVVGVRIPSSTGWSIVSGGNTWHVGITDNTPLDTDHYSVLNFITQGDYDAYLMDATHPVEVIFDEAVTLVNGTEYDVVVLGSQVGSLSIGGAGTPNNIGTLPGAGPIYGATTNKAQFTNQDLTGFTVIFELLGPVADWVLL